MNFYRLQPESYFASRDWAVLKNTLLPQGSQSPMPREAQDTVEEHNRLATNSKQQSASTLAVFPLRL